MHEYTDIKTKPAMVDMARNQRRVNRNPELLHVCIF